MFLCRRPSLRRYLLILRFSREPLIKYRFVIPAQAGIQKIHKLPGPRLSPGGLVQRVLKGAGKENFWRRRGIGPYPSTPGPSETGLFQANRAASAGQRAVSKSPNQSLTQGPRRV